ncbi:MAG TPA: PEGA domain-containing protein [Polyangia bacterium]|nr:PEGA domain-containing protein [Polyangia bacterium]
MGTEQREEETPTMPLIVVRVTAAAATVDEFVARFARYFRDGEIVFVPTEGVQPSGRRVRFVFALIDGTDVVSGEGVVMRMRRDSGDPRRPPGMELRYQILDEASQAIVERLLAARVTPPPYVSMRIDGVADSQQVTLPHPQIEAPPILLTPAAIKRPSARLATLSTLPPVPLPSPDEATRGWRLLGVGLATAAAMLAMTIALAMIRRAPPAIGGNGVTVGGKRVVVAAAVGAPAAVAASATPPVAGGPRPASTGAARPPPEPPRARAGTRPVELHVTTTPTGALVFVDGHERGASPLRIAVAAGTHDVVAERPRWSSAHAHVDGGGRVQLALERPLARLRVTSTPPGAAVRLDGRDVGVTPLELDSAAYELHRLRLERDGRVWRRKVYLRPPGRAVSVDQAGAIRVANDLGERVRP